MGLINYSKLEKRAKSLAALAPAAYTGSGLSQIGSGLTNRAENFENNPDYVTAGIAGGVDLAEGVRHYAANRTPTVPNATTTTAPSRFSKGVSAVSQKLAPAARFLAPIARVGKYALPGVSAAGSAYSAYDNFRKGDYLGAAFDAASGATSFLPGAGALISPAIDAVHYGIDTYKNTKAPNILNNQNQQSAQKIQQFNQSGGQLDSKGNKINIAPPTTQTSTPQSPIKMSSLLFKNASQFKKDLENPDTGLNSDLYTAIAPMIGADREVDGPDADRVAKLKENVRKGLVGLEYLTGLKKNTGETFYDEHPVQAVATDIAGSAPLIGAGIAAGGVGLNQYNQWKNFQKTEPASMAREGNKKVDITNSADLLDPAGRSRPDVSRVFGDFDDNLLKRLNVLDRLEKTTSGGFVDQYNAIMSGSPGAARDRKLKELLTKARNSNASTGLKAYADVHQSLNRAQTKGGLKGAIGESLHSLKGKGRIGDFIAKHLAPDMHREVGDLFEKKNITGANPHFDEQLIKDIVREYRGGGDFSQAADPKGKAFVDTTLKGLRDRKLQASGLMKGLRRHKLPLIAGAATTTGLAGMYGLLKAIQNSAYSDEKRKDWKKTLLQSRGEFDEADKLK